MFNTHNTSRHLILVLTTYLAITVLNCTSNVVLEYNFNYNCPKLNTPESVIRQWRFSSKMMLIGSGMVFIGSSSRYAIIGDNEPAPPHSILIPEPFWIDKTEVTLADFHKFVTATNFITTAETLNSSFVFWMEYYKNASIPFHEQTILNNHPITNMNGHGPWWWLEIKNINWKNNLKEFSSMNLPVTHVSWTDAMAYCKWNGQKRLPSEVEWEHACRGGLRNKLYPWGNKLKDSSGRYMTNIWQGSFPYQNTEKDGYLFTAPVASFPPNGYGLHDMSGNVWEWTSDNWFSAFSGPKNNNLSQDKDSRSKTLQNAAHPCADNSDLKSSSDMNSIDNHIHNTIKIQKGGSFLCHRNHCFRYRCSSRTKSSIDSSSSNVGFRCAASIN